MTPIYTLHTGLSARLFAAVTIVSLLLSAFPVAFFVANAATEEVTVGVTLIPNPADDGQEIIRLSNGNTFEVTVEQLEITDLAGNTLRAASDLVLPPSNSIQLFVDDLNNDADTVFFAGTNVLADPTPEVSYDNSPAEDAGVGGSFKVSIESDEDESDVGANESPEEPVKPIFECYVDNGDNTGTGYFGYLNQNNAAVDIAIGNNNKVTGGPNGDDEGQPTNFMSGRTDFVDDGGVFKPENAAFAVDFPLNDNVVWTLTDPAGDTRTATAGTNGSECPAPEPDPEPVTQCIDVNQNLLDNGSFETPVVVNNDNWIYTLIPDWVITALNGGAPQDGELHNDWNNNQAADGDQYAELDSRESVKMSQTAAVLEGGLYELSWAFAPRHSINANENQLSVLVDGTEVATEGPDSLPAGLSASDWTRNSTTFTAASDSVEIAFADAGATSDSFGTFLDDARLCLVEEPEPAVNLHTTKIVCEDESELPNGDVAKPITADTAQDWVDNTQTCALVDGWEFEWADQGTTDPGDTLVGSAGSDWTTFTGSTQVPLEAVNEESFWVREVLQEGYIPFTHGPEGDQNTDNVTAEMYCHTDALNYDNFDRVDNPKDGDDYYCVAWNSPVDPDPEDQNQFTFSGIKFNNENQNRGRETGEETLYDWDFNLYKEVEGVWTFVASTTVNPADAAQNAGKFVFPQQTEAGTYHVCEESQFGWEQVRQDWSGTPYHIITDNLSPNAGIEGPYCATAVYTDEKDRSKAAYFGNFLKEIPTQYGDITMCKEDEQGNQLSGWQLALLGDMVDTLAFAPTAAVQTISGVPAGDYVVQADGTYGYGNGGRFADARFSERKPGEVGYATSPYTPWREALEPNQGLAVQVEGDSTLWGSVYSPAHVYYGAFTQPALGDIDFSMYDNQYADNTGTIDLTLYQGFTGITGKNGCVVFEDVPYGDYEVAELLQGGFENTSGLGPVVVDEDEETFTVVNNDLSFVPPCELDIYSDEMTLVKETNQTAQATYDGNNNWTANIANAIWVWATNEVEEPENDETYTFVETFTVTNPSAANLTIAHDNWLKLTINDTVIERDQNGYQDFQKYDDDILAALVSGENRIEMEVTNIGTDGSSYLSNPAGALFHIAVTGEGDSCTRTTEPASSSLTIDNPAVDGETLSGTYTFMATYDDFDNDEDEVFWAIRAGSCNGTDVVGNAPASPEPNNPSTFNPVTGAFETTVDMSGWNNGDYCLVVNPREDTGAPNERETRTFVLANSVDPEPETETISGYKYNDTNGNGVLDDGEVGEPGWTITAVEIEGTSATQTAITNEAGFYSFDLPAGEWSVTEEEQEDWTQTAIFQNGIAVNTEQAGEQCFFDTTESEEDFYFAILSDEQLVYEPTPGYTCDFLNQPTEPTDPEVETRSSSRSSGTRTRLPSPAPTGIVAGVSVDQCPFLTDYMQIGDENETMQVMKLQIFLNIFKDMFGGTENPITGNFGSITDANVKAFQEYYRSEVLDPWFNRGIVPHNRPTGFVYKTTLWKINSIVCPDYAVEPDFAGETLESNVDNDLNDVVQD